MTGGVTAIIQSHRYARSGRRDEAGSELMSLLMSTVIMLELLDRLRFQLVELLIR